MATPELDEKQIRETAYLFWLDEGQPEGRDAEHWQMAIDALTPPQPKKRARKATAKKAAPKVAAKAKTTTKTKAPAKKKAAK